MYYDHFNGLRNYEPLYTPEYVFGSVTAVTRVPCVIKKVFPCVFEATEACSYGNSNYNHSIIIGR